MISVNIDSLDKKKRDGILKIKPELFSCLERLNAKTCKGSAWTGWFDYPSQRGNAELAQIQSFYKALTIDYDCVLVVGIGGSYLGTKAIVDAICPSTGHKEVFFLGHHLGPAAIALTLNKLTHRNPLVVVVSKSGTTIEPAIGFRYALELLRGKYPESEIFKRVIAVTDPNSGSLRSLVETKSIQSFSIPIDVGGRYSVLTPAGLVPLILAGYDVSSLMTGAGLAFKSLKSEGGLASAVVSYVAARHVSYQAGKKIELLSIFDPELASFCEWWKQLFGESEGKEHKGIFPSSLVFTTDLHSLGQYAQDGERILMETFLSFSQEASGLLVPTEKEDFDGISYLEGRKLSEINCLAMKATKEAHVEGGVDCLDIHVNDQISERSLGGLLAFFQVACAISGEYLGINPFDQPGVEAYKKNMFRLLGKPRAVD